MEKSLLNPRNDYVFKYIFTHKSNKKVLISLLRAILQIDIRSIVLLPQEIPREGPFLKSATLDIVAELDDGIFIDIEMQMLFYKEYIDRILYYWAKHYTFQAIKGKGHGELKKTISITILNDGDGFFPHAHSRYKLIECDCDPKHVLTDKEEFHFIDLECIEKIGEGRLNEDLIRWMKFFKSKTREEMKVLAEQDACIGKAVKTLEIMSLDEKEVYEAWSREKFWWDQEVREKGAEERGRVEGREEGREEGIEIGEKKGREEGRKEGIIQTAKAMIAEGVDIGTVCKATGLSREDLA